MSYIVGFAILVFLLILFFVYKSYFFQFLLHKLKVKKAFLNEFKKTTKGRFIPEAYFGASHKIISVNEYKSLPNKQKINFSKCYNVITFKTPGAQWELFFHIIKEGGMKFTEILNVRVFSDNSSIRSEGNVERTYGRVNVLTNNHYLTKVLEAEVVNYLTWLMRYDGDMLLIAYNNLHFKAFMKSKKLSVDRAMDMVKSLNGVKNGIYKKDVLEY